MKNYPKYFIADLIKQENFNLMNNIDIANRKKANEELSKIFYSGSNKIGKY